MQIKVYDNKLEKLLNNPDKLIKKVGLEMSRKIKQRFQEILSSSNFYEYLQLNIGKPHRLTGNLNNFFGINLNKNYRLIVEPIIDKYDDITLKQCKVINVKGVCDYHDSKCDWLIP